MWKNSKGFKRILRRAKNMDSFIARLRLSEIFSLTGTPALEEVNILMDRIKGFDS